MLGYLSADIICSKKRTVFREHSSRKAVGFEEQIMSSDKYPSILKFSPQMEAVVLKGLGHAILGNFKEFRHGSNSHRIN